MKTVFSNAKIILEDKILKGKYLVIDNDKIEGIYDDEPEGNDEKIDCEGKYLSPGFVDIHIHGGGGFDFNDATLEAFEGACALHLKHGTTALCPTMVACSEEELKKTISCYEEFKGSEKAPRLLGLHLEGPYLSPEQSGAIDPEYIKDPKKEEYLDFLNSTDSIKRITAAPEIEGVLEFGDELKKRGIIASIGHSDAEYSDVKTATEHGFSHVTHLYSAMSMVHRKKAYRKLGVVESTYLLDNLTAEIIADGCHLPIELIELIIKNKGTDKICLITDAMRGAGLPNGTKTILGSLTNGQEVLIEENVAFMPDMSCFAGSCCTADRCIKTLYKNMNIPLEQVVKMMTVNPCKVMSVNNLGKIEKGYFADLVIFDEDINVSGVFVGGKRM